jgi:hypothetical protein
MHWIGFARQRFLLIELNSPRSKFELRAIEQSPNLQFACLVDSKSLFRQPTTEAYCYPPLEKSEFVQNRLHERVTTLNLFLITTVPRSKLESFRGQFLRCLTALLRSVSGQACINDPYVECSTHSFLMRSEINATYSRATDNTFALSLEATSLAVS